MDLQIYGKLSEKPACVKNNLLKSVSRTMQNVLDVWDTSHGYMSGGYRDVLFIFPSAKDSAPAVGVSLADSL